MCLALLYYHTALSRFNVAVAIEMLDFLPSILGQSEMLPMLLSLDYLYSFSTGNSQWKEILSKFAFKRDYPPLRALMGVVRSDLSQ